MNSLLSFTSNLSSTNTFESHASLPWFGSFFLSSNFDRYLNVTLIDEMLTDESLQHRQDSYVLAFGDITRPDESLKMRLDDTLPGMYNILQYILLQVGEDPEDISSMELLYPGYNAFHGSLFVIRSNNGNNSMLHSYMEWLQHVAHVIESDPNLPAMIRLSNRKTYLRSIVKFLFPFFFRYAYSSTYPPIHSIADCLASYYFHKGNIKVITAVEYAQNLRLQNQRRNEKLISDKFNLQTIKRLGLTYVHIYLCITLIETRFFHVYSSSFFFCLYIRNLYYQILKRKSSSIHSCT